MGNQNSKGSGASTPKGSTSKTLAFSSSGPNLTSGTSQTSLAAGADLSSYPSFSKADTKESNRSFRGALRNKIPGAKTDSPRGSTAGLNGEVDKSDSASVKSGKSSRSA
jgi:serine/threonine-protein phosphatase PP1 catalytic subunit